MDEELQLPKLVLLNDEPTPTYHEDGLNMRAYAEVIAGAASGTLGPFTMGVFGRWGEGKSSVLRQALSLVEQANPDTVTVWFNAWQYDHEAHPIVPLALEIVEAVDARVVEMEKEDKTGRWITLREIGAALRAVASGLIVKTPFLDIDIKNVLSEIDHLAAADAEEALRPGLYQKAFRQLQKASAAGLDQADGARRPPIVVFIDDLDRCLPKHGLRLLQAIRLVLSQPGFIFVLALDREPIVHYLARYYDELGMDSPNLCARSYLDKMVQLPLWIPPHERRFSGFLAKLLKCEELQHHPEVGKAVAELSELLTSGTEANPRSVVRLVNSLIADQTLWQARGKEVDAEWLGFCGISRVLRDRLGDDDYRTLVHSDSVCNRIALDEAMVEALEAQLRAYDTRGPERLSRAEQVERKLFERIDRSQAVQALLGTTLGRSWLKDHAARREIEAYLGPEREQVGTSAIAAAEHIEGAIRDSLGLSDDQPVTGEHYETVEELHLAHGVIGDADLVQLGDLTSLTDLDLWNLQVTDAGLEHLQALTSLTDLDLRDLQVTDAGLEHLQALTSLRDLGLWNLEVTDAGLEHLQVLTSLTALILWGLEVTDAGLEHLQALTSLTNLGLWNLEVTDAGLEHLQALTSLRYLFLGRLPVTDGGLEHLQALTSLTDLGLWNLQVTDAGLEHLQALTSLTDLTLWGLEVTDAGLEHLQALTSLTDLTLRDLQVTDAGLEHLQALTSLRYLTLWGLEVTDAGLEHLQALSALTNLKLEGLQVTDAGRRELREAIPLLVIQ